MYPSSLLSSLSFTIGGYTEGGGKSYSNESVNEGDVWEMEVDMRSREKEKRTLHFFVRGKQQKGFFKGVPDRVKFGVSYLLFFSCLLPYFFYFYLFSHIYPDMHSLSE